MSDKKNCWEVMKCGRQPGGESVDDLGVCPAATFADFDKVNCGHNGGRVCWAVAGTFCKGSVQGVFATKIESCIKCPFFKQVATEEDYDFVLRPDEQNAKVK
jgi:hypothetical protein